MCLSVLCQRFRDDFTHFPFSQAGPSQWSVFVTDRLCSAPPDSNLAIAAGLWSQVSCWALSACLGDYRSSRHSTDNVAVWGAPPWSCLVLQSLTSLINTTLLPNLQRRRGRLSLGPRVGEERGSEVMFWASPLPPMTYRDGVGKGVLEDSIFRKMALKTQDRQTALTHVVSLTSQGQFLGGQQLRWMS